MNSSPGVTPLVPLSFRFVLFFFASMHCNSAFFPKRNKTFWNNGFEAGPSPHGGRFSVQDEGAGEARQTGDFFFLSLFFYFPFVIFFFFEKEKERASLTPYVL